MSPNGDIGRLVAELPRSEPQVLARAREAMINGRNDLALQILEASVERHPSSNMRIALGHVLARERRYKDAMKHMVAILRDEPRNSEALLLLTNSLIECGEYDRASKMLGRASACDADPEECKRLSERLNNLLGETASNVVSQSFSPHEQETRPDQSTPGVRLGGDSDVDIDDKIQIPRPRERKSTMQGGRPVPEWDVGDPRGSAPGAAPPVPGPSTTPETLRSGTFSTLSGWSDDATIESGIHPGPDMGVPAGSNAPPPQNAGEAHPNSDDDFTSIVEDAFDDFDDFEVQATMAFVPDDEPDAGSDSDYAKPGDRTSAIVFDDDEVREASPSGVRGSSAEPDTTPNPPRAPQSPDLPRSFEDEQPTRERDSVPNTWGTHEPDPSPTKEDVPSKRGMKPVAPPQGSDAPVERGGFEAPAPQFDSPSVSNLAPNPFGSPSFQDPQQPPPQRREPTGLTPAASAPSPKAPSPDRGFLARRWPLLLLAFLLVAAIATAGIVYGSAYTQSQEIRQMLAEADEAAAVGTYQGYVTADSTLDAAARHASFLGQGVDDVVQSILPPMPGIEAVELKRASVSKRAYLTALIEYRFEDAGTRQSADAIERAESIAPNASETIAAKAYHQLALGRPHAALDLLRSAPSDTADELVLQQARVEAHLDLNQPAAAALAVKNIRTLEQPTIYQRILVAKVDLALDDPSATEQLAGLRKQDEDNITVRILQAYTLTEGDEARETAIRSLNAVESKLKANASTYQLARVATAKGFLAETAGDQSEAERHYRSGINRFPKRADLYLPLVALEFGKANYGEVENLLEKAKKEGAEHPLLAFDRARLMILESKPNELIELLEDVDWKDPRREFYLGLAHLNLGDIDAAAKHFEAGSELEGEFVAPVAFSQVVRAIKAPEEAEKAAYQVDRLASKHPRDAFVRWAYALIRLRLADQMEARSAFADELDKAEKELDEAIKLEPGWPLFHFTLCDVHLRGLEGKDAARSCETGQKMAPNFVPGLVTFAELRLQQGKFEEAGELLEKLLEQRPNEDRIALLAARNAIELGQLDEAEETINAMLGKPISNGFEMKLLEGRLAFTRRDYVKASGYLASAHELRPQDGEAAVFHAVTLARLGKYEDAEKILEGVLQDRVWSAAAWVAFGEVRRRQERYRDAFENLGIARRKIDDTVLPASRTSELYLQYALTYRDRYDWNNPRVLARLETALEKGDPNDPDVHFTKGLYYLKRRRPNEEAAARSFQKVVDVAPWRCDAIKPLLALYKKLDEDEKLKELEAVSKESCEKED